MKSQDWEGKELDKDILVQGNKVYSPVTCIFVTKEVNCLFNKKEKSRGDCPIGVSFHKRDRVYLASCSVGGKYHYIGSFSSSIDASNAYKSFKYKLISTIANKQCDRLKSAMLNYVID